MTQMFRGHNFVCAHKDTAPPDPIQRQPRKQTSESRLDAAFVLSAALASASCVVVFHRGLRADPLITPSLFDFTAAGALVVTNYHPAVEPYFVFGEELVGFHGEEDLVTTIRQLLSHPQEAERICQAGGARTLRDHTWASVWREIVQEHCSLQ